MTEECTDAIDTRSALSHLARPQILVTRTRPILELSLNDEMEIGDNSNESRETRLPSCSCNVHASIQKSVALLRITENLRLFGSVTDQLVSLGLHGKMLLDS